MQGLNWNDLRYVLAVGRHGTLAAAARLLGVDDTTVARRLAAVQGKAGARLYQRVRDGTLRLTPAGECVALLAEKIEREVGLLDSALSGVGGAVAGTVRVTSVPIVVNQILVPSAKKLSERHPHLRLELVADARDLSLTRREADMAVRLARPKTGGTRVTARRIGALRYEAYAAASFSATEARKLRWVTYAEDMGHLPQARWIAAVAKEDEIACVRVNDAEGILAAVLAGIGRSLLPCVLADRDPRLIRVGPKRGATALSRELWLLTHSEMRTLRRIEAAVEWIEQIAPR
jgi:DNA-binding transcriptional LysR family regulator